MGRWDGYRLSWEIEPKLKPKLEPRGVGPAPPLPITQPNPALLANVYLLTYMHRRCILMHMRTTLNIDDEILRRASELTGIKEKTSLVRLGLEALIARESSKRLADLGGTEKDLQPVPRKRIASN